MIEQINEPVVIKWSEWVSQWVCEYVPSDHMRVRILISYKSRLVLWGHKDGGREGTSISRGHDGSLLEGHALVLRVVHRLLIDGKLSSRDGKRTGCDLNKWMSEWGSRIRRVLRGDIIGMGWDGVGVYIANEWVSECVCVWRSTERVDRWEWCIERVCDWVSE